MALFLALTLFGHLVNGLRNADLHLHMKVLIDMEYKSTMMTYDLRRLLRKGIIYRVLKNNRYFLTPYVRKVCRFFTRLNTRVLRPTFLAITSPESFSYPQSLRKAFDRIDRGIDRLIDTVSYYKETA